MTTHEQYTPALAAKQISEKAEHQLAELAAALTLLRRDQAQANAEREQITAAQAGRVAQRETTSRPIAGLEQKHRAALNYAQAAQGTVGEQEAIRQVRDLEKQLGQARAYADQIERETAALDVVATARLATIDQDLENWAGEILATTRRIHDTQQVRDQARHELGQRTYDAEMAAIHEQQARIDQLKQELTTLQIERQAMIEQSAALLAPWPDFQRQMLDLIPYDDALTRTIETCRAHVQQLTREGQALQRLSQNWLALLTVDRDYVYNYSYIGTETSNQYWHERARQLDLLLQQHRRNNAR